LRSKFGAARRGRRKDEREGKHGSGIIQRIPPKEGAQGRQGEKGRRIGKGKSRGKENSVQSPEQLNGRGGRQALVRERTLGLEGGGFGTERTYI